MHEQDDVRDRLTHKRLVRTSGEPVITTSSDGGGRVGSGLLVQTVLFARDRPHQASTADSVKNRGCDLPANAKSAASSTSYWRRVFGLL